MAKKEKEHEKHSKEVDTTGMRKREVFTGPGEATADEYEVPGGGGYIRKERHKEYR